MINRDHLNALEVRLSHERDALDRLGVNHAGTNEQRRLRLIWVAQIEREISAERTFLGLPPEELASEASDDDLLAELGV